MYNYYELFIIPNTNLYYLIYVNCQ